MLAGSRRRKSHPARPLSEGERLLLTEMVRGTPFEGQVRQAVAKILVEDMSDGGMGSVRFSSAGNGKRQFGRQISEASFVDADGVPVSATLNLDNAGELFELDLWKVDNSPLRRYPTPNAISVVASAD